jgi:hypothetical protein
MAESGRDSLYVFSRYDGAACLCNIMYLLTCMNLQGPIHVTELSLGDEFPIFSNARIRPSDDIGSMVSFDGQ